MADRSTERLSRLLQRHLDVVEPGATVQSVHPITRYKWAIQFAVEADVCLDTASPEARRYLYRRSDGAWLRLR